MKLYFAPGACSLADHIALHAAGLSFAHEKVDLKARRTESGADFITINPKGYVPVLELDSGEILTENVAILDWIAHQVGHMQPPGGALAHTRHLEALAFISTEVHKSFKPFFANGSDEEKKKAAETIGKRLSYLAETLQGDYLFGKDLTTADCYLFVMLLWAGKNNLEIPAKLAAFKERMMALEPVRKAMTHEGLIKA